MQDPFQKKKINHKLPVAPKNSSKVFVTTHKQNKRVPEEEREYVLDPKPPSMTLGSKKCVIFYFLKLY